MKKVIKKLTLICLSVVAAVCGCVGLSACSSSGNGGGTSGNGGSGYVGELYGKWDEYDGVKVGFADEDTYNGGEIISGGILPELNCKLGEKQYMIVDFVIQAPYDNDGRENVTAAVRIRPASSVSVRIQETDSGNVSNEVNGNTAEIKATYKIPEKADTVRNMRLVIQFEAKRSNLATVDLTFESSGDIQAVKTPQIEKSAVMGYTEVLEYSGNAVNGVSDNSVEEIVIPNYHDGKYITRIRAGAFYNADTVKELILPYSIAEIGENAFGVCYSLESITVESKNANYKSENNCLLSKDGETLFLGCKNSVIPDGVKSIGDRAFEGCGGLTELTIPDSVMSIGLSAFRECSGLKNVTIPDSVADIGYEAFGGCPIEKATIPTSAINSLDKNKLKTVVITSGDSIANNAFSGCADLIDITMPDSVTAIGDEAFSYCRGLESVTIPDSVMSIGLSAFRECSGLESIMIPNGVTSIGHWAFSGCSGLESITIPNGVKSIGESAFRFCDGLKNIAIPKSVTGIGNYAFSDCREIESIVVENGNTRYKSENNCLLDFDGETLITGCNNSVIPDGVTSIFNYAFSGCADLADITFPDNLNTIGSYAFSGCYGLSGITIPESVTSIGSHAFFSCSRLTDITLPFTGASRNDKDNTHFGYIFGAKSYLSNETSVPASLKNVTITADTSIKDYAFNGCSGLASITLPESVTSIGAYAFCRCSGLKNVTIPDGVKSIGSNAFISCSGLTNITIPKSVTDFGGYVFGNCSGLTGSVTISDGVTEIGNGMFNNCSGLTDIIIPDSVKSIGGYAFSGCAKLTKITVPDSVESIGNNAFSGCSGLTEITLPFVGESKDGTTTNTRFKYIFGSIPSSLKSVVLSSCDSIGNEAFKDCSSITSITLSNSVTSFGLSAFDGCSGLTSITIPDSVTSIGSYAFKDCDGLTNIVIPDSVSSVGTKAFENCNGITQIENGISYVDKWAIACGDSVKQANLKSGTRGIGSNAFDGCIGLTSIAIPDSLTYICWCAFHGCSGLTSITIPDSVTNIGVCAFDGCCGITSITIPSSVINIDEGAFQNCGGLTSITVESGNANYKSEENCLLSKDGKTLIAACKNSVIPNGVIIIDGAFYGCDSITSVVIPKSVENIDGAFVNCSGLESIIFEGTKQQWYWIHKGSRWDYGTGDYTVHCTDGDLTKAQAG